MLTRYVAVLLCCGITSSLFGQEGLHTVFSNRTLAFNVGYGVPNLSTQMFLLLDGPQYVSLIRSWGPFHFRAEQSVSNKFGIGFSFNIAYMEASWKVAYYNNPSQVYNKYLRKTAFSFLLRSWIHFVPEHQFIDPYFSFGFGYRWNQAQYDDGGDPYDDGIAYSWAFPLAFEATLGFRYYITRNMAVYMETGIAKSIINFGLTLKFEREPIF